MGPRLLFITLLNPLWLDIKAPFLTCLPLSSGLCSWSNTTKGANLVLFILNAPTSRGTALLNFTRSCLKRRIWILHTSPTLSIASQHWCSQPTLSSQRRLTLYWNSHFFFHPFCRMGHTEVPTSSPNYVLSFSELSCQPLFTWHFWVALKRIMFY